MARRSDHNREELRELALSSAHDLIVEAGYRGLTARKLAERMGYTPGTIYNLFKDLDELLLQVNTQTLGALHEQLASVSLSEDADQALRSLSDRFLRFVEENANLWGAVIEGIARADGPLPDWYLGAVQKNFSIVEGVLAGFFPPDDTHAVRAHARALWSAIYGISSMQKSEILPDEFDARQLVAILVMRIVDGLRLDAERRAAPKRKRPKANRAGRGN